MKTVKVICKIKVEGFHHYPDAPQQVDFLRHRHRHVFHITAMFHVEHMNRDLEIFMVQDELSKWICNKYGTPCEFGAMSCEHIADDILKNYSYKGCRTVEVLEDGDGGAIVSL